MEVDSQPNLMHYKVQVPFPNEKYAEIAMKAIGVEAPFSDSKNKKSTITREMFVETLDDGIAYLTIDFKCDKASELNQMRTCASSFFTNLGLVCQTMVDFGN